MNNSLKVMNAQKPLKDILGSDYMRENEPVPKAECSFNWLSKIVNSWINTTLNYVNLD